VAFRVNGPWWQSQTWRFVLIVAAYAALMGALVYLMLLVF
jgi:hypothetical protein